MAISKSGAQCVARRRAEFGEAVARWPHPQTFGGMEMLDVVGHPGNKTKLKEYRENGIIEVAKPETSAKSKQWRFSRWVYEKFEAI